MWAAVAAVEGVATVAAVSAIRAWMMLGVVAGLLEGCAARKLVLTGPTRDCLNPLVFTGDPARPTLAPGVKAVFRKGSGPAVVKLEFTARGGFPFKKAGFEPPRTDAVFYEYETRGMQLTHFSWGLVDACGSFLRAPDFTEIDLASSGKGVARRRLLNPSADELTSSTRDEFWVVDLERGDVRAVTAPRVDAVELIDDELLFYEWYGPAEGQGIARIEDFGVPGRAPVLETRGRFDRLGRVEGSWALDLRATLVNRRPMRLFEASPRADALFVKRAVPFMKDTWTWFDRSGRALAERFGGEIVAFEWNHFVVRPPGDVEAYSVRRVTGEYAVAEYHGEAPRFGPDFVTIRQQDGTTRYFTRDLAEVDAPTALATIAKADVARAEAAKANDREYAALVKQRAEEAQLMARVRAEQARVEAERAAAARTAAEAEAARKRAEEEAEQRKREEERRVQYEDEVAVLAVDQLPKGWPFALRPPVRSMAGRYLGSGTSCDLKSLDENRFTLKCSRVEKTGVWLMERTRSYSTGEDPLEFRLRAVKRSNASFMHGPGPGGPEYRLWFGDGSILLVYREADERFLLRIDNYVLERVR